MSTWRIAAFLVWSFPAIVWAEGSDLVIVQKVLTFQEVSNATSAVYVLDCPADTKLSYLTADLQYPFGITDQAKRGDVYGGNYLGNGEAQFDVTRPLTGNWTTITLTVACIKVPPPAEYRVVTVSTPMFPPGTDIFEYARCPAGLTILGGGAVFGKGSGKLVELTPLINTTTSPLNLPPINSMPIIWSADAKCESTASCRLDVTAVCAALAATKLAVGEALADGQQAPPQSKRVEAKATIASGTAGTVGVTCPAGTLSTSAGYTASDVTRVRLLHLSPRTSGTPYRNRPSGTYEAPNGWTATMLNTGPSGIQIGVTAICVAAASPSTTVIEFFNTALKHYFRTAETVEATAIDGGAAGPGWMRTGLDFTGYVAGIGPGNDVCRFYNPVANTHFYTADPDECTQVKLPDSGWRYEGLSFRIQLPSAGICPQGTIPVRRLYNNRFAFNDSNHRFTTSQSVYDDMVAQGWLGEGVVMCALA